nr:MAG TPA: hypothetical protein [Caudoviricetes sp.]
MRGQKRNVLNRKKRTEPQGSISRIDRIVVCHHFGWLFLFVEVIR